MIFIGAHDPPAREKLISEYWEILPNIYDRKGAVKAAQVEAFSHRFASSDDDVRIFRHLRNPAIFSVEPLQNKRFREDAERRWSFAEIVKELTSTSELHMTVPGLQVLNHIYGMASHLAHASPKALDLMEDRATREEDLIPLEAGHICRMLSDIVLLCSFSVRFSQRTVDGSADLSDSFNKIVLRMQGATAGMQEEFARSQDEFYSNFQAGT